MINAVIFNDEIKVWWEYTKLYPQERFCLALNGILQGETAQSHFNIKNLTEETRYDIEVLHLDTYGKTKKSLGKISVATAKGKRAIDITKPPYNAVGDGKTLNTQAIQRAIDDCKADERVYFPDGIYLTGALDLKSELELYLEDNAVLQGTADEKGYLPKIKSRFEGTECLCYRSLLNAGKMDSKGGINCENILIRGGKILGGGGELRANIIRAERARILKEQGLEKELNPPAFYASVLPGRARGRLFGFNNVKNVIIANGEWGESPSWNLHFVYCEDVITCSGKITSHKISNGDGWDPDSSKNCVLFDMRFDTGDDCVAIKSGKNLEGYKIGRPSERIRVFDVEIEDGHGIAVGSEMSGGVKDVAVWNCRIPVGTGIYLKSSPMRGGYIKDVRVYNCFAPTVTAYGGYDCNNDGEPAPVYPAFSDLVFEDITVTGVGYFTGEHDRIEPETAFAVQGIDEAHPIQRVKVKNLTLKYRQMLPEQWIKFNDVVDLTLEDILALGEA